MRIEAALIIKEMWLNLGRYKSEFIPALVGDVFSVTLIKVTEIRREILFLLFDMINFETLSSRQFKFDKFQEAIVSATDVYFNQNLGDQSYVEACFHLQSTQVVNLVENVNENSESYSFKFCLICVFATKNFKFKVSILYEK